MNGAYWHIATNHIPVVAMPFIFFLLLGGLLRKSQDLIKASYAAAIVVALITIFVWKTGGPAARVIWGIPGIQRADIHEHVLAAGFGLWAVEIMGALALIGLWIGRGGTPSFRWGYFVLVVALWAGAVEARVAHLGGLIRHSEIRAASSSLGVAAQAGSNASPASAAPAAPGSATAN